MTLLDQTKDAFSTMKSSVIWAMQLLYQLRESGEWEQISETWTDFVTDELGLSQGFASRLLTVNRHYLVEGGLSADSLENIDHERLYLASHTGGNVEEQLAKARTLTRRELKEERNDEQPHEHVPITICKTCSLRL